MKKNQGFVGIGIIIAIIVVMAAGGMAYYVGTKNVSTPNNTANQQTQNGNPSTEWIEGGV